MTIELAIWLKFFPNFDTERLHPDYIYLDYAVAGLIALGGIITLLWGKGEQTESIPKWLSRRSGAAKASLNPYR